MPKAPRAQRSSPRDPIPSGPCSASTRHRRSRAVRVVDRDLEMPFRCVRCEKENLRCFVDTATGHCAGCIAVHAECSLFVPESDWERVQSERRQKELEIARHEEQLARSRRELLEIK